MKFFKMNSRKIEQNSPEQDVTCLKSYSYTMSDYCDKSTVHGVIYFGEKNRPIAEKIFWIVICIISLIIAVLNIMEIWNHWQNLPTIVTFNEETTPVMNYPFPAVTICPQIKARSELVNATKLLLLMHELQDELDIRYLFTLFTICDEYIIGRIFKRDNISEKYYYSNYDQYVGNTTLTSLIKILAPKFTDVFEKCQWKNIDCLDEFFETITDEGLCYTFNGIEPSEIYRIVSNEGNATMNLTRKEKNWSSDGGYKIGSGIDVYPKRSQGGQITDGLSIILKVKKSDIDYLCSGPVRGFKISMHSNEEVPEIKKNFVYLPIQKHMMVMLMPNAIITSDSLRRYSPEKRKCFYTTEQKLDYFQKYTQRNCRLECLTKLLIESCKCIPFGLPVSTKQRICSIAKKSCISKIMYSAILKFMSGSPKFCLCLPNCNEIDYDIETVITDFITISYEKLFGAFIKNEYYYSQVNIYIPDSRILPHKRSEFFGGTDFLSECGGILSLFLGISVISVIEFLYFCCIRLCLTEIKAIEN